MDFSAVVAISCNEDQNCLRIYRNHMRNINDSLISLLVVCIGCHQKHDYANYDRFVPNFGMAYKTIKRVSVPNLKSFGPTKTEL